MKVLGKVIFALGVALFFGNISHLFVTFPLAGWITMLIGGAIIRAG